MLKSDLDDYDLFKKLVNIPLAFYVQNEL